MENWVLFAAGAALGAAIGGLVATLWMRARQSRVEADKKLAEARLAYSEATTARIGETFQALADAALRSSQGAFLAAAKGRSLKNHW